MRLALDDYTLGKINNDKHLNGKRKDYFAFFRRSLELFRAQFVLLFGRSSVTLCVRKLS